MYTTNTTFAYALKLSSKGQGAGGKKGNGIGPYIIELKQHFQMCNKKKSSSGQTEHLFLHDLAGIIADIITHIPPMPYS